MRHLVEFHCTVKALTAIKPFHFINKNEAAGGEFTNCFRSWMSLVVKLTSFIKALTAIFAYLALFFRGTGSAFSGTLANTRLVKSAGGFPPALLYLRNR